MEDIANVVVLYPKIGAMNDKRVSVCLASYNGESFIKEQVESILLQLGSCDELVVSDDGSTDSTLRILEDFSDARIKIVRNVRHGVIWNFENALKHAVGNYIFLCDQDDVWLPNKIEKCLEVLSYSDLVVTDSYITDINLNIIKTSLFESLKSRPGFWKNLWRNTYIGACMAFRKDVLDLAIPFPQNLSFYHDSWIGSLADIKYNVTFLEEPLIYYRRHETNASSTIGRSNLSHLQQLKNRMLLLILIAYRLI